MDWVVVALVLGTGAFLVVVMRDFQNVRARIAFSQNQPRFGRKPDARCTGN